MRRRRAKTAGLRRAKWPRVLLLLNGAIDSKTYKVLRRDFRRSANRPAVICADGGAHHAIALRVEPKLVIGDFDSLPLRRPRWKETVYLLDPDQSLSDFEKALRFLLRRGAREVYVAGLFGGRPDHVLVNLALLEAYSGRLGLTCVDGAWMRLLGPGTHRLGCRRGALVTLLPATPRAVTTGRGLEYPLPRTALDRSSRGLSNRAVSTEVLLQVRSGRLWAVVSP